MRITVVSRSWPSDERSGVTLVAAEHVRMLAAAGHDVSIIGSHRAVLVEKLPVSSRTHVQACGSGALYSPATVDRGGLAAALLRAAPEVVVVEAWQTALTDAAVDVATSLGIPTLMVSHGLSLHPFTVRPQDRIRAWAWAPYRRFVLPRLIARLGAITALDDAAISPRFFDRDLARHLGVPVVPLVNAPVNWVSHFHRREQRKLQVLVVGYYSRIKNQLCALDIAASLPETVRFLFVGPKRGRYYGRCIRHARKLSIVDRVAFVEDGECDLAEEMSRSLVVLSPSVTEALPLTLLEAMACGTPFAATPVGAVPSLRGGLHADSEGGLRGAVQSLIDDPLCWHSCSEEGLRQYADCFSRARVAAQLLSAVEVALRGGVRKGCHGAKVVAEGACDPSTKSGSA